MLPDRDSGPRAHKVDLKSRFSFNSDKRVAENVEWLSDTVVETNHAHDGTSKYRHIIQCE